jgi:hypothetical protein
LIFMDVCDSFTELALVEAADLAAFATTSLF